MSDEFNNYELSRKEKIHPPVLIFVNSIRKAIKSSDPPAAAERRCSLKSGKGRLGPCGGLRGHFTVRWAAHMPLAGGSGRP